MPVPQGGAPSRGADRRITQPLPDLTGLDLVSFATDVGRPVLAAVAESLLWRAGVPDQQAFYDDAPYIPPDDPATTPHHP